MPYEPGDECPYPKPFPEDFGECPAYQPRLIFPTDISNRPLNPAWTCAHLQVASRTRGGWYASCGIGDATARRRWLEDRGELGAVMASVRSDVAGWGAPLLRRLMAARKRSPLTVPAEVEGIREALVDNFDLALVRHQAQLTTVRVDLPELRDAFSRVIDSFLEGPDTEPVAPPDLVATFGPAARILFKPELEAKLNPA